MSLVTSEIPIPHDEIVEAMTLSAMLYGHREAEELLAVARAEDFFDDRHIAIANAIAVCVKRGQFSIAVVRQELIATRQWEEIGGMPFFTQIADSEPMVDLARSMIHALKVRELADGRRVVQTVVNALGAIEAGESLETLVENHTGQLSRIMSRDVGDGPQHIAQIPDSPDVDGLQTGFPKLDEKTRGLHKKELCVVAARPSVGKSAWMMTVANSFASSAIPTSIFSIEMPRGKVKERLMQIRSEVNYYNYIKGYTNNPSSNSRMKDAIEELNLAPIFIDDSAILTVESLKRKVRRLVEYQGLEVLMIDYLGKMTLPKADRHDLRIAEATQAICELTKTHNLATMLLCQLNRDSEKENRPPRKSDLRDAGSIEQDADTIILLHRPRLSADDNGDEVLQPKGLAIVDKARNGPTGRVPIEYFGTITKFKECFP